MTSRLDSYRRSLEEPAERLCNEAGLLLVELELAGSDKSPVVRLFVDREGGVTVDECSRLSRRLGAELDELDILPFRYRLEVSSPGVGRPFRHRLQYEWSVGKRVKVVLGREAGERAGCCSEGILAEVLEDCVVIRPDEGGEERLPFSAIKEASRVLVF